MIMACLDLSFVTGSVLYSEVYYHRSKQMSFIYRRVSFSSGVSIIRHLCVHSIYDVASAKMRFLEECVTHLWCIYVCMY